MEQITVTVGPLGNASATNIAAVQTPPGAFAIAMTGALTAGSSANNIALSQSLGAAGPVTLNGARVSAGVARFGPASVQIISAGDDSGVTFTITGFTYGPSPTAGPLAIVETVTGANTSRVATKNVFYGITSIVASGATGSTITVGTNGVATLDKPRRVLLTFGTSEATNTFTITGTDWNNMPVTEVVAGAASTAASTIDFKTVASIKPTNAPAGTISVGTNGVSSSRPIYLDKWAFAPVGLQVDATGTVSYTVQSTYDDPNQVGWANTVWVDSSDTNVVTATGTKQSFFAYAPRYARVVLNSGSGSIVMNIWQSGNISGVS